MLWILINLTFILCFSPSFGLQYKPTIENFTIDYADENNVEATAAVYDYNTTAQNRINLTMLWKLDLPEDTKINIKVLKWVKNDYKLMLLNVNKRFKELLDMELFGVQTICQQDIRPPLIWPLRKNVNYKLTGYHVDLGKVPPNMPTGKWLLTYGILFGNKTKLLVMSWRALMEYE